jgi:hypothetical protein
MPVLDLLDNCSMGRPVVESRERRGVGYIRERERRVTEDDGFVSRFRGFSPSSTYTFHSRIRLQVQNVIIANHSKPRGLTELVQ